MTSDPIYDGIIAGIKAFVIVSLVCLVLRRMRSRRAVVGYFGRRGYGKYYHVSLYARPLK